MVIYLETCESGSMFENILSSDINIYAATAARKNESSWGDYCPGDKPNDDEVDGKHIHSCLGDLFSTNWMENTDQVNL